MSRVPKKSAEAVKNRDEFCVRCGRGGSNVHHRRMRSQSPKAVVHNLENMIVLCGSGSSGCHGWVHGNPEESYKQGWLVESWQSPEDVPVRYASGDFYYLNNRGTRILAEGDN